MTSVKRSPWRFSRMRSVRSPLRDFEEFEGAELEVFQEAKGALILAMDGLENSEVFEAASAEEVGLRVFSPKWWVDWSFLEIVGELSGCGRSWKRRRASRWG